MLATADAAPYIREHACALSAPAQGGRDKDHGTEERETGTLLSTWASDFVRQGAI